jgi:acyl carrier protein
MTQEGDAQAELRHWLVDYLVTNLACSPEEIDLDAPFNELGVGSRDAVVLSGELSEHLGQPVSPVDFWQNPTINALAAALLTGDAEMTGVVAGATAGTLNEPIAIIGLGCRLPGDIHGPDALWDFLAAGRSAVGTVPDGRWQAFDDGTPQTGAALAHRSKSVV